MKQCVKYSRFQQATAFVPFLSLLCVFQVEIFIISKEKLRLLFSSTHTFKNPLTCCTQLFYT